MFRHQLVVEVELAPRLEECRRRGHSPILLRFDLAIVLEDGGLD